MHDITISLCSADRWFLVPPLIYKFGDLQKAYPHLSVKLQIVDDTVSYDYEKYLRPLCDSNPSVSLIKNLGKKGLAGARNFALDHCTTSLWTFIDDDDWLDVSFFKLLEKCLKFSDTRCFIGLSERRCNLIQRHISEPKSDGRILVSIKNLFDLGYTPPVSYQIFRRNLINDIRYDENIQSGIDHDLWVSLYFNDYSENISLISVDHEAKNYFDDGERLTRNFDKREKKINATIELWAKKFSDQDDGLIDWLRTEYRESLKISRRLASYDNSLFRFCYLIWVKIKNKNLVFKFRRRHF